MAKTTEKEENKQPTKAEKRDGAKTLIRSLLANGGVKSNDLIDEAAKLYAERFGGEENDNLNDAKGRIGSLLDVMKKEGEVFLENGVCTIKKETVEEKTPRTRAKKKTEAEEEKPVKAKRTTKKAKEEVKEEVKTEPLPVPPLQPIAPVVPVTPETAPEPKKRGRKAKAKTEEVPVEAKAEETPVAVKTEESKEKPAAEPKVETENPVEKKEEKQEEKNELVPRAKAELSPKGTVMDISFLLGEVKPKKEERKKEYAKPEVKQEEARAPKAEEKKEQADKPQQPQRVGAPKAEEKKEQADKPQQPQRVSAPKAEAKKLAPVKEPPKKNVNNARSPKKQTADEKLQEAFLSRLHRLGGEYFEYYSVYLLEKYSRRNGRRLEGLKISAGDHDGGIDGEIELTDRLGFRETIYIQAKNWDPDKGDERLWTVGETLLQQFIGACVCRQAKDGKQHCRGIFMTTSRFTPEAKRMFDDTSDKFVGYDGTDIFETAKECEFGIIRKNGEWVLDDELLSGTKAFFTML